MGQECKRWTRVEAGPRLPEWLLQLASLLTDARRYGTEPAVGRAMKRSGVPREEVFLVTKLWNNAHHPEDVERQCDASLMDLGSDYVDLYLMHWPCAFARGDNLRPKDGSGKTMPGDSDYVDTWKAMEQLVATGKAKAIGISNFSKGELERLMQETQTVRCHLYRGVFDGIEYQAYLLTRWQVPAVHQMELHPWLAQKSFVSFHKDKGIHVTHYSPFGNQNPIYSKGHKYDKLIGDATLEGIGRKYLKTPAQVALAWGITQGNSVIPKSKTAERIEENWGGDFKLEEEDMKKIEGIDRKLRFNDPSAGFGWNFYSDLEGKD